MLPKYGLLRTAWHGSAGIADSSCEKKNEVKARLMQFGLNLDKEKGEKRGYRPFLKPMGLL